MWTTVLVLALALNFEPHRLGIIGLLLIGRHPIRQLLIFLVTSFAVSASAGLLILFAVDRTALINGGSGSAKMQIVIGAVLFIVAAVLFSNISVGRHSQESVAAPHAEGNGSETLQKSGNPLVDTITRKFSGAARLVQESSPWLAVILGVGIALPSVDYIALLLLIATSGMSPRMQITALFTFLTIANTVLLVPIFSYLVAKERTIRVLEGLRSWVLARRRRDYALLLGIAGALLIAVGIKRL
ncbi:MAG: GAP family protein [Mycobacterium sp.]|nr:GAP family protein [Mycobacterium sp.]